MKNTSQINVNSILFPSIKLVHFCLHLLYEDLKLNVLRSEDLKLLGVFLNKLSRDLGLVEYSVHYWKDFPDICTIRSSEIVGPSERKFVNECAFVDKKPASVMNFIYDLMQGGETGHYPFVNHVNNRSRDIIEVVLTLHKFYQYIFCVL